MEKVNKEIVTPEILYKRYDPIHAERRLATAVFLLCLKDLLDIGSTRLKQRIERDMRGCFIPGSHLKDQAEAWVFSPGVSPGSFEWYCQLLDYSPDLIRLWVEEELPGLSQKERRKIIKKLPGTHKRETQEEGHRPENKV